VRGSRLLFWSRKKSGGGAYVRILSSIDSVCGMCHAAPVAGSERQSGVPNEVSWYESGSLFDTAAVHCGERR
jgi:hypothetical protein